MMKSVKLLIVGAIWLVGVAILPSLVVPMSSHEPVAWCASAQDVSLVEGKVLSIGEESFVVQVRRVRNCDLKGLIVTVVWDEDTQWTRGKRTASPDELWVGAAVTVSGTMVNSVLYADTVHIGGGSK